MLMMKNKAFIYSPGPGPQASAGRRRPGFQVPCFRPESPAYHTRSLIGEN